MQRLSSMVRFRVHGSPGKWLLLSPNGLWPQAAFRRARRFYTCANRLRVAFCSCVKSPYIGFISALARIVVGCVAFT